MTPQHQAGQVLRTALAHPLKFSRMMIWEIKYRNKLRAHPPVFVFQMGKVSSRSVYEPLSKIYTGQVIHDHVYGNREKMQGETHELQCYLESRHPPEKWYLISLVREPILRNVSAFFANLEKYSGEPHGQCSLSIPELKKLFLDKFPHDQPLIWYQKSIQNHFGVDVFATPFPKEGVATYRHGALEMLLMRMELGEETKNAAVSKLLDLPGFRITRANETESKQIGALYKTFRKEVRFPASFVNRFCESQFFRHFYPTEFIEKTRAQWTE